MMTIPTLHFCGTLALWIFLSGCQTKRESNDQRNEDSRTKNFFSIFSPGARQNYRLPSGRELNLPKYVIEPQVVSALGRNPFKLYVDKIIGNESTKRFLEPMKEYALSEIEGTALVSYSSWSYALFKDYLEGKEIPTVPSRIEASQAEPLFLATIAAVNKLPKYKGTVYFGACLDIETFRPLLSPEKIFAQRNFTSTSTDPDVSLSFATCSGRQLGSFLFTVLESKSGAEISKLSLVKGELEILFLPGHPFRVMSFKKLPNESESDADQYEVVLTDEG